MLCFSFKYLEHFQSSPGFSKKSEQVLGKVPPQFRDEIFCWGIFLSVGGQEDILTIWTFLTIKYGTLIKIKISMTSVYKEYKVNIKL